MAPRYAGPLHACWRGISLCAFWRARRLPRPSDSSQTRCCGVGLCACCRGVPLCAFCKDPLHGLERFSLRHSSARVPVCPGVFLSQATGASSGGAAGSSALGAREHCTTCGQAHAATGYSTTARAGAGNYAAGARERHTESAASAAPSRQAHAPSPAAGNYSNRAAAQFSLGAGAATRDRSYAGPGARVQRGD